MAKSLLPTAAVTCSVTIGVSEQTAFAATTEAEEGEELEEAPEGFAYLVNGNGEYLLNADGEYILAKV